jgi:hypothetical protein
MMTSRLIAAGMICVVDVVFALQPSVKFDPAATAQKSGNSVPQSHSYKTIMQATERDPVKFKHGINGGRTVRFVQRSPDGDEVQILVDREFQVWPISYFR